MRLRGLNHKLNIPYRNYRRSVARDRRPRSANVWYDSITQAICNRLAYSFHNHCKSQESFSLPFRRGLQVLLFPSGSQWISPGPGGPNQEFFCRPHKGKGWKATKSQQLTLFIHFRTFLPQLKSGKRLSEVWRSLHLIVYIGKKELLNPHWFRLGRQPSFAFPFSIRGKKGNFRGWIARQKLKQSSHSLL